MRVLFIVLLLAGCGGGDEPADNNNHGYGFQFDSIGASGMKLRGGPDPSLFEAQFAQVETCTGLSAPAPFIIIVQPGTLPIADTNGQYISRPSLILLDISNMNGTVHAENSAKHEFVHYLLDVNTGDRDAGHKSHFFQDCT